MSGLQVVARTSVFPFKGRHADIRETAEDHFRRALELDPFSPSTIHSVAKLQLTVGNLDAAVEDFRASLALDPAFPWSLQGLK